MLQKFLLICGVVASLVYVGTDVLAAIVHPAYHSFTARVVSELMARGAPTERLVDPLFLFYDFLMMAFAVGVWRSGKRMRLTAGLLFAYAVIGLLGPTLFEMNVRGSGGNDVPHMALTGVMVLFICAFVIAGAGLRGRWFRLYSWATLAIMLVFGVWTSLAMRGPTPWVGLLERINIGALLVWVVVLALSLWPSYPSISHREPREA